MNSSNVQIQGTNDSSIVSKLSSSSKGYYEDGFLKFFCNKSQQRSPLINRGYYIRHEAIEAVFKAWFQMMHCLFKHSCQIISLGAGFDTSYFRLRKRRQLLYNCRYIEIDFPEVAHRKKDCIGKHQELSQFLTYQERFEHNCPEIVLFSDDYILLGLDLSDIKKLDLIISCIQLEFNIPTLFLSECAITYMDVRSSEKLIRWVKKKFPDSAFVTYEQVYPNDGFGLVMQNHFNSLGSALKSVQRYPDLLSQKLRFLNLGWASCFVRGMKSFWLHFSEDEKKRIANLELFDEFETWHGKCLHYVMVLAYQGVITVPPIFDEKLGQIPNRLFVDYFEWIRKDADIAFQRYGHQVLALNNDAYLIFGGFGQEERKHQRLSGLIYANLNNGQILNVVLQEEGSNLGARMHHSMVMLKNGPILIYGGRSAPNKPYRVTILLHPEQDSMTDNNGDNSNDALLLESSSLAYRCTTIDEKGNLPEPRWRHTANLIMKDDIDHLFIFGGCTSSLSATDDCYMLNTVTWTWTEVPKNEEAPSPRHSHSCVIDKELVIISGGLSASEKVLSSVHTFNISTKLWCSLNIKGMLPRYSHTSHMFNNKLFLFGGITESPDICPYIACIDLTTQHCIEIHMPTQDPESPILLHNHASVLCNDEVVIIGGGGNCFSFGTHFNKDVLTIKLK